MNILYKVNFIKTDLTEVTQNDVFNKSYQIKHDGLMWDIVDVSEEHYNILCLDKTKRYSEHPLGLSIKKSDVKEIYKPVIELVDETLNQLLILETLKINIYES